MSAGEWDGLTFGERLDLIEVASAGVIFASDRAKAHRSLRERIEYAVTVAYAIRERVSEGGQAVDAVLREYRERTLAQPEDESAAEHVRNALTLFNLATRGESATDYLRLSSDEYAAIRSRLERAVQALEGR